MTNAPGVPSILWVLGAIVATMLVALNLSRVLGTAVPQAVWGAYIAIGAIAALIVGITLWSRSRPAAFGSLKSIPFVLSLIALGAACDAIVVRSEYYILAIVALHWAIVWLLERRSRRTPSVVDLALIFVSWAIASPISWYQPVSAWLIGGGPRPSGPLTLMIFFVLLLFNVTVSCANGERLRPNARSRFFELLALIVFALFSFRQDSFADLGSQEHWGFYVGPAELIRQGGWLLWDVPSQYGFLNMLAIAALPFRSAWLAMYLLDGTLLLASAAMLFFVIRLLRIGPFSLPFAGLVTLVAVFLVPGWNPHLSGPQIYPSVGAMRFFWVEIAIVFLLWVYLRPVANRTTAIVGGSLLWLCGVLWAAESAVYMTFVWFPSLFFIVLGGVEAGPPGVRLRAVFKTRNLTLLATPLFVFGCALALIHTTYVLSLGHGPDYYAFFEYAVRYGGGFGYLPMNPFGAVSLLFLAFATCVSVGVAIVRRSPNPLGSAPVLWAASATIWITSSYFVGRSHDANVTNLFPPALLAVAAVLVVLGRERLLDGTERMLRLCLAAPLTVAMLMTLGNTTQFATVLRAMSVGYTGNIPGLLEKLSPSALAMLQRANVHDSDAIIFEDENHTLMPQWPEARYDASPSVRWLPANPSAELVPLPAARRAAYLQRFTGRRPMEGWFLRAHSAQTCESFDSQHVTTIRSWTSPEWDLSLCYLAKTKS